MQSNPDENSLSPLILDGGMGQELIKRVGKKPTPLWGTAHLLDDPEAVQQLHQDYISAGARVITINAYAATPGRILRDHHDPALFEKAQHIAVTLANKARDAVRITRGPEVRIAGSLPPLRASYQPNTAPDSAVCEQEYEQIVTAQVNGVDLFLLETMANFTEAEAALKAASRTGKPVWVSFLPKEITAQEEPQLRSGEPLTSITDLVLRYAPAATLLNCASPETIGFSLPPMIAALRQKGYAGDFGAYANRFVSVDGLEPGGTVDVLEARVDPGPEQYADLAEQWCDAGCRIVGGCCEIGPEYIAQLSARWFS